MSPLIARLKELERLRTPGEWWTGPTPSYLGMGQFADGKSRRCNPVTIRSPEHSEEIATVWTYLLPTEANAALIAASPSLLELAEALEQAATRFQVYADLHTAKGTPEGNAKAQSNADLANMCRTALANLARRLNVKMEK